MDGHAAAAFFIIHLPVFQIIVAGEARVVEGDFAAAVGIGGITTVGFAGDIFGFSTGKMRSSINTPQRPVS